MNKEAELEMKKYLKSVRKSLDNLSREELEDRLATIKAHFLDAIKDQGADKTELEIVKSVIKDLGVPKILISFKDKVVGWVVLTIVGIGLIVGDILALYPLFGYSASIPYFLIVFTGEGGYELWQYLLKNRITDKRLNLIYAWIFLPVLLLELWILEITIGLPEIGQSFRVSWLVLMIYSLIVTIFSVMSIVIPGELLDKTCPNCGEILPYKSKYCLNCGEELE